MRFVFLALLCVLGGPAVRGKEKPPAVYTIPVPPKPDFSLLDWLVGEWTGKTTGRGAQGEIRLSVTLALEKRFMVLREEASLAAGKTVPASRESWMGILGANSSGPGFFLRAFSSTGFITYYRVTVEGTEIRFNPEGGEQPPPGWLFRRVLQRSGDAEMNEAVEAAPPGKAFFNYYSAKLTRTSKP